MIGMASVLMSWAPSQGQPDSSPATGKRKAAPVFFVASAAEYERAVYKLMAEDPDQRRKGIEWSGPLASVARRRAEDMVRRNYFAHTDPDGLGPNGHVATAGIPLPAEYAAAPKQNFIESIARGPLEPPAMWKVLSTHAGHREHVLGIDEFWALQPLVGVGAAFDRARRDVILVVLSLPRPGAAPPGREVKSGRDLDK